MGSCEGGDLPTLDLYLEKRRRVSLTPQGGTEGRPADKRHLLLKAAQDRRTHVSPDCQIGENVVYG